MKYPVPSYAAYVWAVGDDLMIAFPGQGPNGQGHTIKLPASPTGLSVAIKMFRDRQYADDLRLSNKGTPSQWDTDMALSDAKYQAWLKAMGEDKAKKKQEKEEAEAFLRELGL